MRKKNAFIIGYFSFVTVFFAIAILMGINNSSMGLLTDDGNQSSTLIAGEPRTVRSDEFLRGSPTALSFLQGSEPETPFDAYGAQKINNLNDADGSTIINNLLGFDGLLIYKISQALPLDSAYSLSSMTSLLYTLILLPLFLIRIGINPWLSALTTSCIVASPVTQWWSLTPLGPIANSSGAAFFALSFVFFQRPKNSFFSILKLAVLGFLAIAFIARVPFTYQPWAIPIGLVFFSIALAYYAFTEKSRVNVRRFTGLMVTAAFTVAIQLFMNSSSFSALAATVYPGERRSTAAASVPIWSGDLTWTLQHVTQSDLISSNQSELSLGLLVLFPFILISIFLSHTVERKPFAKLYFMVLSPFLVSAIFLLWVAAPWPSRTLSNNPLVFFPPDRVQQILGLVALIILPIALTLLFNLEKQVGRKKVNLAILFSSILMLIPVVQANQDFSNVFTSKSIVPPWSIWVFAFVGLFVVAFALRFNVSKFSLMPILVFTLFSSFNINPVYIGLGDIIESPIAKSINQLGNGESGYWAGDDIFVDALITANGVDHLSGQQNSGPNRDYWKRLDPNELFINSWNRGASYVTFDWKEDDTSTSIENPAPDIIKIAIDPCGEDADSISLKWVLSSKSLENNCLDLKNESYWMGAKRFIYLKSSS